MTSELGEQGQPPFVRRWLFESLSSRKRNPPVDFEEIN